MPLVLKVSNEINMSYLLHMVFVYFIHVNVNLGFSKCMLIFSGEGRVMIDFNSMLSLIYKVLNHGFYFSYFYESFLACSQDEWLVGSIIYLQMNSFILGPTSISESFPFSWFTSSFVNMYSLISFSWYCTL